MPLYDKVDVYAQQKLFPGGQNANRKFLSDKIRIVNQLEAWQQAILFDPQTSGGLLIAVPGNQGESLLAALKNKSRFKPSVIGNIVNQKAEKISVFS